MQPLAVLLVSGLLVAASNLGSGQAPPAEPPSPTAPATSQQAGPPQAPARDARRASASATGVIRGRVVSAESGEALRHARVELNGAELRTTRAVPSDLDGRFEFKGLPPGRFSLRASKNGYVALGYGQRRSFQSGKRIDLAEGQVFEDASIALPRGAVIAGRVVNDVEEPVSGVRVGAYRLRYLNGRQEVVPAGQPAQTDDLGQYRVSGLPPGTYFVGTIGGIAGSGQVAEEGVALTNTYHPATANIADSRPVTVRLAQESRSVDIAMIASRAASVTGTVLDSRGRPAAGLAVTVRPAGDSFLAMLNSAYGTSQPNGQFTVRNLMPGEYTLHAVVRTPDSNDQETADVPLSIGGTDVEGLVVTALPNCRIVGRVTFEGESKPTFPPGSLRLSVSAPLNIQTRSAQVGTAWEFEIGNIEPGRVTLAFDAMPAGWAVKRIMVNERDVTESPLDLAGAGRPVNVEITLTDKPTSLSGVVRQESRTTAAGDYTVVVFADNPAYWREGSKRVLAARPDQNGTYKLTGLPPGRYRAIAVEYLDDGEQWNPEFLRWAESRAAKVELAEGAAVTLNLTITKYAN
jgi:hypothetical protein